LFRPVMSTADGMATDKIHYDPEGDYIWIDYVYAVSKRAIKGMRMLVAHRIGQRGYVAWEQEGTLIVKRFKDLRKEHAASVN